MRYLRQLLALAALGAFGFAFYIVEFAVGAGSSLTILFYRGLVLAAVAAVVTGIAGAWLGARMRDSSLAISAAAVSFSLNVCFLVLLPVTVDRSVTVYLLSTIEQQQGGMTPAALQQAFVAGYVDDMHAIGRRIDEQRRSGNISVGEDGKVRLTTQGHRFMGFSRTIAWLFGTDPRFVSGKARSH